MLFVHGVSQGLGSLAQRPLQGQKWKKFCLERLVKRIYSKSPAVFLVETPSGVHAIFYGNETHKQSATWPGSGVFLAAMEKWWLDVGISIKGWRKIWLPSTLQLPASQHTHWTADSQIGACDYRLRWCENFCVGYNWWVKHLKGIVS